MKEICIKIIPHTEQRYPTVGDYWIDENGVWQIRVSELNNTRSNLAVIIHELWEQSLCFERGISEDEITKFDKEYENNRKVGNFDEPGDDKDSPYKKEHCSATGIERIFLSEVNEDWSSHEDRINAI